MKLGIICPTEFFPVLEKSGCAYHMVLGQELAKSDIVKAFYRRMHFQGHFIMVDNGAAEPESERVPFAAIVAAAKGIFADEIVMPDVMYDCEKTIRLSTDWETKGLVPAHARVVVPQGRDWTEWAYCLSRLEAKMDFATIGVAKHLELLPGGRARALEYLVRYNYVLKYNIHLFGVWNNPLDEIRQALCVYPYIRGIDTGAPIAFAQNDSAIGTASGHFSLSQTADAPSPLIEANIRIITKHIGMLCT